MQLNITRIRYDDYGEYHCVCKNELNTTTGILFLNGPINLSNCFTYAKFEIII